MLFVTLCAFSCLFIRVEAQPSSFIMAGTYQSSYNGDNQEATLTTFNSPTALWADSGENLFVADTMNFRIRRIDYETKIVTTVIGNGEMAISADTKAISSSTTIDIVVGLWGDSNGNLYFTESFQPIDYGFGRVRILTSSLALTTLGGGGNSTLDGIPATTAIIQGPSGIWVNTAGVIYYSDSYAHQVRQITTGGIVSTIAGVANYVAGEYTGSYTSATGMELNFPVGLWGDGLGNLYISDYHNNRIRVVTLSSPPTINTVAGNGQSRGLSLDNSPATSATILVNGLNGDTSGNVYVFNHYVRRVYNGLINSIVGVFVPGFAGDGGITPFALYSILGAGFYASSGTIYFTDASKIRYIPPANVQFYNLPPV